MKDGYNLNIFHMTFITITLHLISLLTLTGRQMTMRRRSAVARLARKVLVGDLKEDFRITVNMIRMLPHTPRQNVKLEIMNTLQYK